MSASLKSWQKAKASSMRMWKLVTSRMMVLHLDCQVMSGSSIEVAEIKDRSAIRTEITLQTLMEEAAEIQRSALAANQHSAAVAALTAKAKLAGLWVERSENENLNATYVVSSDPVDNVEEWEAEYAQKH
jgi:hypothetical protein